MLIFISFYLICFLLKIAVAIPLKKSRKRKPNVFLRGICFLRRFFLFMNFCNKKLKEMSIYFMGFALFFSPEKEKMILGYCAKIQGKEDAP